MTDSALPRAARQGHTAGIGLMLLGILLFSLNDVMGKWLVATYPVGQVLLVRGCAALLILSPLLWRLGAAGLFRPAALRLNLVRLAVGTLEVAAFYTAVSFLPLADTMTFYLAGPVYVTAASALLLGERVSRQSWIAVLAAFVGVLITLRPSAATLTWPALIAVSGSLLYSAYLMTTRAVRGTPDLVLIAWPQAGTVLYGLLTTPGHWVQPPPLDFMLLGLLGVVAMGAAFCVNRSLTLAPASVVVPYQYTLLLWAVIFGYLVFGDRPDPLMLVGAAIIVLAGLFLFLREHRQARIEDVP